jgi:hypothetical protein
VEEYVESPTTFTGSDTYDDILPSVLAHPSCLPVVDDEGQLLGLIDSTSLAATWQPDSPRIPRELASIVHDGIEQALGKRSDRTGS